MLRFKNGALGNIVVSNSQNPALYGRVYVHGSNGATIGVQTDGGAMFIAGMSSITEPPINDLWTVPGEQEFLKQWQKEDSDLFSASIPSSTITSFRFPTSQGRFGGSRFLRSRHRRP